MDVEISKGKYLSCNFCREKDGSKIYEIKRSWGGGLCAAICENCIEDLNKKIADGDV